MPLEPMTKQAWPPGNKCWCDHGEKEHCWWELKSGWQEALWKQDPMGSSHPTSRYMSKGNELCNPQTYLSVHVYCEATHHSQGCNHLRPSPTRTREKEGQVNSRILLICKDEWDPFMCSRMNRTGENCTKWSKPHGDECDPFSLACESQGGRCEKREL